jgi:hypothetical protein
MPQCQFLFSAIFVFQKSYTWNILGIGRNEAQSSYFSQHETESKAETEDGQEAATPPGGAPPLWPRQGVVWAPGPPPDIALLPIYSLWGENPKSISIHLRKVLQRCCHRRAILGDISLCSDTLPGRGIAPGATSIESTAISIDIADSHDEEGVVLPRGWGLYR